MNDMLKQYLDSMQKDVDILTDPTKFDSREEMGDTFKYFIGYDPTRYWDYQMMSDQIDKLSSDDGYECKYEEREEAIDRALEHYDAVKSNLMLQVAQKTIKELFDRDVTADDLNLDLDYLLESEIFGTGYDDEEEDDDNGSLLDELDDEDDDVFDDDNEDDLVD